MQFESSFKPVTTIHLECNAPQRFDGYAEINNELIRRFHIEKFMLILRVLRSRCGLLETMNLKSDDDQVHVHTYSA